MTTKVEPAPIWGRAAAVLKENEDVLSQRVSDRCFSELASYRDQQMPQEESAGTVKRLLEHIVRKLHAIEEGDVSGDAQALHDELVTLEEGIAARRVRMAIEFEDLVKGIHIMRQEVWAGLARVFEEAPASQVFGLERRINDVFDEFFIGLASSYIRTQKELVQRHESSLAKWEEVVKSAAHIHLKIPCREEYAATVRLQAEAIARRVMFTEEEIYDIITAVGEVCDNSIEHGKSEMGIDVQYIMDDQEFRVEVQDYGTGFDPSGRGDEPPDLFSERGRGIFLMKHLMDRLEIDSQSGRGTRVVIAKSRHDRPQ